jgi:threonine synthase
VIGEGDRSIATTVVSEKNGWLKLAAYGFTFSKKTIRAKITKAKPTKIVCVATADPAKTKKVKAVNPKCPKGFTRKS